MRRAFLVVSHLQLHFTCHWGSGVASATSTRPVLLRRRASPWFLQATVDDLKRILMERTGVPEERQRLLYLGRALTVWAPALPGRPPL